MPQLLSTNISILIATMLMFMAATNQQPSGDVQPVNILQQITKEHVLVSMSTSNCQTNCAICSPPTFMSCQQCATGYVLQASGLCVACPPGCQVCIGEQLCSQCRSGYAPTADFHQTRCIPCSMGCSKCILLQITQGSTIQLTTCQTCFSGYYIYNQTNSDIQLCAPCITGCFTCQNTQACFQCVAGFGYNQTSNLCYPCQDNCYMCSPNIGCQSCAFGYRLDNYGVSGRCVPCLTNCMRCMTNNSCTTCIKGYYPLTTTNPSNQQTTTTCIPCPNNCIKCYNQNYCLSCGIGYYLNVITQVQYNSSTDSQQFDVLSSSCQPCPSNCNACTQTGSCSQCQSGFFVDQGGNCMLCGVACHQCLASGQCLSCLGSYYLMHGVCKPCVQPCTSCHISTTTQSMNCTGCISLYWAPINGQCVSCSYLIQGCLTCQHQNECLSCQEAYNLHQGQCILKNHQMGALSIVMICIAVIIGVIAIGFGVWAFWKYRTGTGSLDGDYHNPGLRATYYQIP